MKRAGNLWAGLISFPNLLLASRRAAQGKRSRPEVAGFQFNLENELIALGRELAAGSYGPGPYRTFLVRDPKPRHISAAPFRDRVVHHALTQVLEPVWERRFSAHSYACRKGLGTHRALERAREGIRRFRYVLKCDVRKYFASMDHEILKALLARAVKCRPTLDLTARIIDASNPQEPIALYFPGDNLFTPYERSRGLPLGNQTSQFFANVYLNPVDQMIERELQPGCYVRYVDDMLLFDESLDDLRQMLERIRRALWELRLDLHPGKSRVYRATEGVTFLGWRLFPERARLARDNVIRFRRRMRRMQRDYASLSEVARDLGVAVNTAKAWLSVLEATFQVVVLRPYFANIGKRLVKTPKVYFTDTGTLCHLVGLRDAEHAAAGPMAGAVFETAVLGELLKTMVHRGDDPQLYFWRTSSGAEVDIVVDSGGKLVPLEVKLSATPVVAMADQIRAFQAALGAKAAGGFVIHPGDVRLPLAPRVESVPFAEL